MKDAEFPNGAIETVHRYEFLKPFLEKGFIPYIPEFDAGIDFIIWRERDNSLIKIQLKSRWTINYKYFKRDIWIAFPGPGDREKRMWYLVPHDRLVAIAYADHGASASWKSGHYSKPKLSQSEQILYGGYERSHLLETLENSDISRFSEGCAAEWVGYQCHPSLAELAK